MSTPDPNLMIQTCNASDDPLAPDGCMRFFLYKTAAGKCAGCKAKDAQLTEEGKEHVKAIPQCSGCGFRLPNLEHTNPNFCGACFDKTTGVTAQSTDPSLGAAMQKRMQRPGPPPPSHRLTNASVQPTTPLTTAAMDQSRAAAKRNFGDSVHMNFHVFVNGKKMPRVGVQRKNMPSTVPLETFLTECLNAVNDSLKIEPSYTRREIELRGKGNSAIPVDWSSPELTVGGFYGSLKKSDDADGYTTKERGNVQGATCPNHINGELHIWRKDDEESKAKRSRKRKEPSASVTTSQSNKRSHLPELRSSFFKSPAGAHPSISSRVTIRSAAVELERTTGALTIKWNEASTASALIENEPMAKGAMKQVYKATIETTDDANIPAGQYAFKRFFKLDNQGSTVSLADNYRYLQHEVERNALGDHFLTGFYGAVEELGLRVDTSLEFTEIFFVEEVLGAEDNPSRASGLSRSDWEGFPDTNDQRRIIWLVETLRASAPERFTGTLQPQCTRKDRLCETIDAFVHYAFMESNRSTLFADIQGSRGRIRRDGTVGMILFDIMTHSPTGDTGVGDHGLPVIQQYEENHSCNNICTVLAEAFEGRDTEEGEEED